ncbi:MAG: hypothetical protein IKF83_03370 [Clostridia bacterium]|nr:hypothetical protein [Clostridia bacterium]
MGRKWETLYEYYKSENAQERIAYLKRRRDEGQITSEEQAEYDKMQKTIENLPRVENIKEAIEALESNLEILKEEYNNREENVIIDKMEKEASKLEKEIEEKRKEAEKLHKVAENDDYWEKIFEVQNMEETLRTLKDELSETTKKESKNPKLAGLSKQELRKEIFKTAGQISRCNVAAELYIRGESQETIDIAVKKDPHYRKFTAKDPLPLSRKEREPQEIEETVHHIETETRTENNTQENEQYPIGVVQRGYEPVVGNKEEHLNDDSENEQTQALISFDEIRDRHKILSRIAKIPLIGKLAEKRLNKIVEKEYRESREKAQQAIQESTEAEQDSQLEESSQTELETTRVLTSRERRANFIKGLSDYDIADIAEKGIKSLEEQRKKDILLEAKEKAILNQDKKYSKPGKPTYSEKSGDTTQIESKYYDREEEK